MKGERKKASCRREAWTVPVDESLEAVRQRVTNSETQRGRWMELLLDKQRSAQDSRQRMPAYSSLACSRTSTELSPTRSS